jgi:hypothetical protein
MPIRAGSGATWIRPPSVISTGLGEFDAKSWAATVATAEFIAQKMQDDARINASWEDRTGNARTGLFGAVDSGSHNESGQVTVISSRVVKIYLAHTMDYGVYLELSHGEKYAIIWQTIERHLPELKRLLDGIFR